MLLSLMEANKSLPWSVRSVRSKTAYMNFCLVINRLLSSSSPGTKSGSRILQDPVRVPGWSMPQLFIFQSGEEGHVSLDSFLEFMQGTALRRSSGASCWLLGEWGVTWCPFRPRMHSRVGQPPVILPNEWSDTLSAHNKQLEDGHQT